MSDIHDDDVSGYLIDKLGMRTARDILAGKVTVVPIDQNPIEHGAGEPVKTLLDEFAMVALHTLISQCVEANISITEIYKASAAESYLFAEAMMAEKLRRERGK